MPNYDSSHVSDVGLQRSNNEDAVLCNQQLGLWLVADGMGGHAAGEIASGIAVETIEQAVTNGAEIDSAINKAHHAVINGAKQGRGHYGMGSTVVALHSRGERYQVAWVGDSRAYLWSNHPSGDYELTRLSTDHSYVQMLYQSGIINADELESHPEKNVITQCLGSNELSDVHVDMVEGRWHNNDWIILCSDGLNDTVNDQTICDILYDSANPRLAVNSLLQEALKNGGKDNISIVVVAYRNSMSSKIKSGIQRITKKRQASGPAL